MSDKERDKILEEAAKIADAWCERNHWPNGVWRIAADIRSLKTGRVAEREKEMLAGISRALGSMGHAKDGNKP